MSAVIHLPVFRNEHVSVSRLKRFEQCSLAFYLQYIDKADRAAGEIVDAFPGAHVTAYRAGHVELKEEEDPLS